jgi:hypothetical protein
VKILDLSVQAAVLILKMVKRLGIALKVDTVVACLFVLSAFSKVTVKMAMTDRKQELKLGLSVQKEMS